MSVEEVELLITRTKIKTSKFQISGSFEVDKCFYYYYYLCYSLFTLSAITGTFKIHDGLKSSSSNIPILAGPNFSRLLES